MCDSPPELFVDTTALASFFVLLFSTGFDVFTCFVTVAALVLCALAAVQ
jgi:hypothetical protein